MDIREHACTKCNATFVTKSHLQVHVRRHNGDKPYKCDQCNAHFVDNNGLKRHTESLHEDKR